MGGVKFKQHQIICSFIMYNIKSNDNAAEHLKKIHWCFLKGTKTIFSIDSLTFGELNI